MVLETMGRYAGWLALYAGVAGGADVVLLPERPYTLDEVVRRCRARQAGGRGDTVIAVAEGARPVGGARVARAVVPDSPDPVRLGGAGSALADALGEALGSEVRAVRLGHVQRGGPPTAADRVLATCFGAGAAGLAAAGRSGVVVALQSGRLTEVALETVAGRFRSVGPDDPVAGAAASTGVSFGTPDGRPGRP